MAIENYSLKELDAYANIKGWKLVLDPFHGSTGYEFQMKVCGITRCAGCIIGPKVVTFYTRNRIGSKTENYEEVENKPATGLAIEDFITFVTLKLLS